MARAGRGFSIGKISLTVRYAALAPEEAEEEGRRRASAMKDPRGEAAGLRRQGTAASATATAAEPR